ncbi:hypothetical protein R3W88_033234 [Solanum pinnatisectum]|uniref:Mediator of RNA polymerase II transcription subunit 20 n=1 Tax=Solanum pinnatisectum TaxID=50273 RepID=A0AAV9K1M6_9SOLN|nr:hypothetical protein R3W88_033234 [Solanum pinnatisectum]
MPIKWFLRWQPNAGTTVNSQILIEVFNCADSINGGFQYRLDDFWLQVGKVVPINSESLRGIVMEMEYLPISSWETSHLIMSEFFEIWKETLGRRSLPGHFVHVQPNFSEFGHINTLHNTQLYNMLASWLKWQQHLNHHK